MKIRLTLVILIAAAIADPSPMRLSSSALGQQSRPAATQPAVASGVSEATRLRREAQKRLRANDVVRAEQLAVQAVALEAQTSGNRSLPYADAVYTLASVYLAAGYHLRCMDLCTEVLEIQAAKLGNTHPDYAVTLWCKATAALQAKKPEGVEAMLRTALGILEKADNERLTYARCAVTLGAIFLNAGQDEKALPLYEKAAAILKTARGPAQTLYGAVLNDLGILHSRNGDEVRAAASCRDAADVICDEMERSAAMQSQRLQLSTADSMNLYLSNYITAAVASKREATEIYDRVLRWKGATWLRQREMRALRRLSGADGPAAVAVAIGARALPLCRELEQAARDLEAYHRDLSPNGQEFPAVARRRELDERVEQLQRQLAGLRKEYHSAIGRVTPRTADIIACLPADTALVDVLEFNAPGVSAEKGAPVRMHRRLIAFVLRSNQPPRAIDLGPSLLIEQAVKRWRSPAAATPIDSAQQTAAELRRLIWEPVAATLGDASIIVQCPDGPLRQFPLGALPGSKPGQYLIEERAICTIVAAADLPAMLARPAAEPKKPSLLLVGDVDYRDPATRLSAATRPTRFREWQALPATAVEIAAVEGLFRRTSAAGNVNVLRGADATKLAVSQKLSGQRWVHLATHGAFAMPPFTSPARPQTGPATQPALPKPMLGWGYRPETWSGLVFAGANQSAFLIGDTVLSALEVMELDLADADLVTLSTCDSGLGVTAGMNGVLSLQQAFQTAGARSVIAAMWRVPDALSQRLMEQFYINLWVKKMSRVEALRQAQISLLRGEMSDGAIALRGLGAPTTIPVDAKPRRLSPEAWGGFVLSGDWR